MRHRQRWTKEWTIYLSEPMDVCKTDISNAARLLREAAAYLSANAKNAKVADKARQMMKLSKKLQKKIEQ